MRTWFISRVGAFALFLLSAFAYPIAPACAQELTSALAQELARLSAQRQDLNAKMMGIFQAIPDINEQATGAEFESELRRGRAWVGASRQTLAEMRATAAAMPPLPAGIPENIRQIYVVQEQRFPELVNSVERFITQISSTLDAVERRDPNAAVQAALNSLDAISFTYKITRDVNSAQADAIGASHPQSHLLRSLARSYDAIIALITFQRSVMAGDPADRAAVAQTVATAATDVRRYVDSGRRAATTTQAEVEASRASTQEERLLKERALGVMRTYAGSFARELEMAAALDSAVLLLRDDQRSSVGAELQPIYQQFDQIDIGRLADSQRRAAILQGQ